MTSLSPKRLDRIKMPEIPAIQPALIPSRIGRALFSATSFYCKEALQELRLKARGRGDIFLSKVVSLKIDPEIKKENHKRIEATSKGKRKDGTINSYLASSYFLGGSDERKALCLYGPCSHYLYKT